MLSEAKKRAKRSDLPFDLTEADITIPVFCPILGIKLERGTDGSVGAARNNAAPSLDRIIPALGYVRGNVVVISNRANRLKSDGTTAELHRIANFYTKLERKHEWLKKTTTPGPPISKSSTASESPKLPIRMGTTTTSRMGSNVALIDGDIFAYKAAFGNEKAVPLGDDIVHLEANLAETESTIDDLVAHVQNHLQAQRVIVCLSDDANFRKNIFATYKENRTTVRKPLALRHAKEYIKTKFDTKIKDGLEADDVMGILCTHPSLVKGKPIIVTIDKDLLQIPGRHFNPDKEVKRMIGETEGMQNFLMQVLTGDAVDNYPGCPGIGPKRAAVIFEKEGFNWDAIVKTYEKHGLTQDDALVQARVARILRHTDFDFTSKRPILWTP